MGTKIIGKSKLDKQGRIVITDLFKTVPRHIVLYVDVESEDICVEDAETCQFGSPTPVDAKNRVVIPAWLREEIGDPNAEIFFIIEDDGTRRLSVKTGSVIAH